MQTPQQIARDIVAREGGYVNDPDDPGGATKYGVTIHTMRRLGLDLDGDGDVDAQDVQRISRAQAEHIFIDHYFIRPRINQLPAVLQATVFDMYVNAGSHAVKILQRLLNDMRIVVSVDGIIGPQTIAAAQRRRQQHPITSLTLTASPGGTTITRWLTAAPPAVNTPVGGTVAKAAGYGGRKNSSRPSTT